MLKLYTSDCFYIYIRYNNEDSKMSNEFKIEKLNNRLVKYADNNANGKCDKGEELATIDFSDSKGSGKFDKFKMGGNVSLFSTDEVAKDLEGRAFETSSEALPQDEKGNFKVNTNNEYNVGALKNYLADAKKNELTTNVEKEIKTVTTTRPNMDQYHKDVAAAYTPVVSSLQGDGTAFTQSTTALMEDLLTFMNVTVQAERRVTVTEKRKTDETGKGGFVLDTDSSNKNSSTTDVAPVSQAAPVSTSASAPAPAPANTSSSVGEAAPVGAVDKNKLEDCLDLELVDRAGYKASAPEHDLVIDFKDDQWISKVALAVYGEQNAELNKAIADMNGIKDPNKVKVNSQLSFPKVIEINGKSYNAKSCDKSEEEYQADADRIKDEITASKAPSFGGATTGAENVGNNKTNKKKNEVQTTGNKGDQETTPATVQGETPCSEGNGDGFSFKSALIGAGAVAVAPFVVANPIAAVGAAAAGASLFSKGSPDQLREKAKKLEAEAAKFEAWGRGFESKSKTSKTPYAQAVEEGKSKEYANKAKKLRAEANALRAQADNVKNNGEKSLWKTIKYNVGYELGDVIQGAADSHAGQKGFTKAGEVIAANPKTTDLVLKNAAKSDQLGAVVGAAIPMTLEEIKKPENKAKVDAMVDQFVNDPAVMDRIAKEALKAAKGNSKDMAGILKDMLEGSNKEILRGAFKQVAADVLNSDNAQMIDKITEMAMQNVVKKVLNDPKYVAAIGVTYDKVVASQNWVVEGAISRPGDQQKADKDLVKKAGLLK